MKGEIVLRRTLAALLAVGAVAGAAPGSALAQHGGERFGGGRGGYGGYGGYGGHGERGFGGPGYDGRGYGGRGYGGRDAGWRGYGERGYGGRGFGGPAYGGGGWPGGAYGAPDRGRGPASERGWRGEYPLRPPGGYAEEGGRFDGRRGGRDGGYAPAMGRRFAAPLRPPPPPARGFARGQMLPRAFWSGEIGDFRAHRLRRPPEGYAWIQVGPNAYLTQRSSGLILDAAPID